MDAHTYRSRRRALRQAVPDGAILLLGNQEAPRNYLDNTYPFRQDSHLLYYAGVDRPGLAVLLEPDGGELLVGPPEDPEDLVWHGPQPVLEEHAAQAGILRWEDAGRLDDRLRSLAERGVRVHFLPPYRAERTLRLAELLDSPPAVVSQGHSAELVRAVVAQRSVKSAAEVAEIEQAIEVTAEMYRAAMVAARPGSSEVEVAAALQQAALRHGRQPAFSPIVTVRGEVLHNAPTATRLAANDLLLIDSGAESPFHYASDITRTFPVSGRFSPEQRAVYEVVLAVQAAAIAAATPAHTNREVHLAAARTTVEGLVALGVMQGNVEDAVAAGAHALFFPHGIGHMLGLDAHDMEDLGDVVGYPEGEPRSAQFGLSLLRLARRLSPGFVITVEPGVYFIPALIERWRAEGRHRDFILYDRLERWLGFGGVRIEDDVLITGDGARVLGPGIPKGVDEVEAAVGG